jgi:hypothetical protein
MLGGVFAFGVLAAWAKGPNGGLDAISRFRTDLGNVSTPWLLVAFVAGAQASRMRSGALLGLLATFVALVGFCLLSSMVAQLGDHGFVGDLRLELMANRVYFAGGVVSGLAFGALGAWWAQRRSFRASVLVGALLVAEPLVVAAVVRVVPGSANTLDFTLVYAAELLLGVAVLVLAAVRARRLRIS